MAVVSVDLWAKRERERTAVGTIFNDPEDSTLEGLSGFVAFSFGFDSCLSLNELIFRCANFIC